jgi:hypothetical protein
VNERWFIDSAPSTGTVDYVTARASVYIVDVARGLELFKTSPNSLVHLTTILRPAVNDSVLASWTMPNGLTVQIVSDCNISWGIWRVALTNRRDITVVCRQRWKLQMTIMMPKRLPITSYSKWKYELYVCYCSCICLIFLRAGNLWQRQHTQIVFWRCWVWFSDHTAVSGDRTAQCSTDTLDLGQDTYNCDRGFMCSS